MKTLITVILAATLSACGTLGGALEGAGQDLSKLGNTIRK